MAGSVEKLESSLVLVIVLAVILFGAVTYWKLQKNGSSDVNPFAVIWAALAQEFKNIGDAFESWFAPSGEQDEITPEQLAQEEQNLNADYPGIVDTDETAIQNFDANSRDILNQAESNPGALLQQWGLF